MKRLIPLRAVAFTMGFLATLWLRLWPELTRPKYVDPAFRLPFPIELASLPTAARFDFPLGSESGAMAYNAQRFTEKHHLGDEVRRGQQMTTVGTADGRYFAHLHFEMREFITPFIGPGYRADTRGWLHPTAFIEAHRGAPEDDVGRARMR